MRLIKRYSNRKLYDTISKTYITLEAIANLIRNEEHIQVIENDTNEDITSTILAQIIADETRKTKSYSSSLLMQMIQRGGNIVFGSARHIAHTVGETAYTLEEEIESRIKKLLAKDSQEVGLAEDTLRTSKINKVEEYLELWVIMLLHKLHIPSKKEMIQLLQTVEDLESRVKLLNQLLAKANQTNPLSAQTSDANIASGAPNSASTAATNIASGAPNSASTAATNIASGAPNSASTAATNSQAMDSKNIQPPIMPMVTNPALLPCAWNPDVESVLQTDTLTNTKPNSISPTKTK